MVSCHVTSHIPQLSRQLNLLILYAGALQIENSEESDQGKYECVAMNSAGTRYSSPANLYVRGKVRCLSQVLNLNHFCCLKQPQNMQYFKASRLFHSKSRSLTRQHPLTLYPQWLIHTGDSVYFSYFGWFELWGAWKCAGCV